MKNCKDYLIYKSKLREKKFTPRENCPSCGFSKKTCYCHLIKSFDPKITFAILIHKIEIDRKIATGRMSHLILKKSYLITGSDYNNDDVVNGLINNSENHCVVLYPEKDSLNLSELSLAEKKSIFPCDKKLVIFVIDGTWSKAWQTMCISENLKKLPKVSFNIDSPSNFRIRKQPSRECISTVEAIYKTINLLGESQNFDISLKLQDNLLDVFDYMVNKQIALKKERLEKYKI